MDGQLWIEPVGELIIARVRGLPTEEVLAECQQRVVDLITETGKPLVLYDALEMIAPEVKVVWSQRSLDASLPVRPRRAIVVPNTRIAYLARLAFADEFGENRVFYNDISAAIDWLKSAAA
jgi:hypothetical protein